MSTTRITGRVKWFNSKAGYGFITACEGELTDKDIFVHYSSIKSEASHYKYLTQGEYVDFSLTKPTNEKHEYHAVDVSGVKGGPILCETRRLSALASRAESDGGDRESAVEEAAPVAAPAVDRKRKPRATVVSVKVSSGSDGFTDVKRRGPKAKKVVT
jgi:CspA family cold shock protein